MTVIFAILSLAIFSSVSLGINVYKRITTSSGGYKDAIIALAKLEKEIANCIEFNGIDFEGGSSYLEFCSIFNTTRSESELVPTIGRLRYSFDRENGTILKEKYTFPYSLRKAGEETVVIASGLKRVSFSYFYRNEETEGYEWTDHWPGKGSLPAGVRVELRLEGKEELLEISKTIFLPVALR